MRTQLQKDRARRGTRKPGLRKITFSVEALGKVSTGPELQTGNRGKSVIPEHEAVQKHPVPGLLLALTDITQGLWSACLTPSLCTHNLNTSASQAHAGLLHNHKLNYFTLATPRPRYSYYEARTLEAGIHIVVHIIVVGNVLQPQLRVSVVLRKPSSMVESYRTQASEAGQSAGEARSRIGKQTAATRGGKGRTHLPQSGPQALPTPGSQATPLPPLAQAQMLRPPARWRYADSSRASHRHQIQKV
ncbi:hypothetical protein A6R68_17113 [Neotoma lepida]|uniref:Uncharacterized protein n=1 Tax=Neotoma lepida TaxID=56216 RepID=A0A1A6HD11_NEOLE|nr:hypothetical protein A6R68_17113 [Neotoma lepida]